MSKRAQGSAKIPEENVLINSEKKKRVSFRRQQAQGTLTLPEMSEFRHVCELSTWHQVDTGWTWAEAEAMDASKCRGLLTDVIFHVGPFIHMMNVRWQGWALGPTKACIPERSARHPVAPSAHGSGASSVWPFLRLPPQWVPLWSFIKCFLTQP